MKSNLLCELEVRYKRKKESGKPCISKSMEADSYFREILKDEMSIREVLVALYLNQRGGILGYYICSIGGRSGTIVDNKIILTPALLCGAVSVIVAHNHPSGNSQPSEADRITMRLLANGCKAVGLTFLDSMILSEEDYYSFADEGVLPTPTL